MDPAVSRRARGGGLDHQRGGRGTRFVIDEGPEGERLKATARACAEEVCRGSPGLIDAVRDALYASKIISYAQGFALFAAASQHFHWNLHYGDIATIWRGGCIIRAKFLNRIKEAFDRNAQLENLMLDPFFSSILKERQERWRQAVSGAVQHGVAVPAFSASLAYFDSYRQERLPANLLQAQRDYFGAHKCFPTRKHYADRYRWLGPHGWEYGASFDAPSTRSGCL